MSSGRQTQFQQGHYLRLTVNYNDANVATGKAFRASIPAGAVVTSVYGFIVTPFNGGTTNVLTAGTNSTAYNNLLASGGVAPGTVGGTNVPNTGTSAFAPPVTDAMPYATYTYTGTAPTAGQAILIIHYEPNNDG